GARGYRSVLDAEGLAELHRLRFADYQCRPGLLLPSRSPDGRNGHYQLKPDQPRIGTDGKPIKYETPAGSQSHLDAPPTMLKALMDPRVPLHFTEGDKKAAAGESIGICVVALMGVFNFTGAALADLAQIPPKGR